MEKKPSPLILELTSLFSKFPRMKEYDFLDPEIIQMHAISAKEEGAYASPNIVLMDDRMAISTSVLMDKDLLSEVKSCIKNFRKTINPPVHVRCMNVKREGLSSEQILATVYDQLVKEGKERDIDYIFGVAQVMMLVIGKNPMNVSVFVDVYNLKLRQIVNNEAKLDFMVNCMFFLGMINLK